MRRWWRYSLLRMSEAARKDNVSQEAGQEQKESGSKQEVATFFKSGDWEAKYRQIFRDAIVPPPEHEIRQWNKVNKDMTREQILAQVEMEKIQFGQRRLAADFARAFVREHPKALTEGAPLLDLRDHHDSSNVGAGSIATKDQIREYYATQENDHDYERHMQEATKAGLVYTIGVSIGRVAESAQSTKEGSVKLELRQISKLYPKWVADEFYELTGALK